MFSIRFGQAEASSRWLAVFGGLTLSLAACSDAIAPRASEPAPPQTVAFANNVKTPIPDQYIVVFKNSVSDVP